MQNISFPDEPSDLLRQNKQLREEWRHSERSLRRANKRIVNILDSITDMYLSLNRDWEITYVNTRAESILGLSRAELVGRNVWEQYPHTRHQQMHEKFHYALDKQAKVHFVDLCALHDLWLEWSVFPSQDGLSLYARDITAYKQAEDRLQEGRDRMQDSLNGIVQAMLITVEMRDPYTAGHQRRVSRIATRIAALMGLPDDQIEGVRVGALLHDIGKNSVPMEILNRPGPLSKDEESMVRMHVDTGYEILKAIQFAAPVALMARQHHERMDGSGYPCGLCGYEIILEARILAVADVVEAMASHRPYRPALGLPLALKEIVDGKGTRYDANAVDACLELFRQSGFDFEQAVLEQ